MIYSGYVLTDHGPDLVLPFDPIQFNMTVEVRAVDLLVTTYNLPTPYQTPHFKRPRKLTYEGLGREVRFDIVHGVSRLTFSRQGKNHVFEVNASSNFESDTDTAAQLVAEFLASDNDPSLPEGWKP
jgi:hypothetical protein